MNWKETIIDIGEIKEGATTVVNFEFTGECIPEEVKVKKSCGCISARWDKNFKKLSVSYAAGKIPRQVTENYQLIKKVTKMHYICNNIKIEDSLTFTGKVIK